MFAGYYLHRVFVPSRARYLYTAVALSALENEPRKRAQEEPLDEAMVAKKVLKCLILCYTKQSLKTK